MAGGNEAGGVAGGVVTLNLQDFIPYPLKILQLKDLLLEQNSRGGTPSRHSSGGSGGESVGGDPTELSHECPFDCCQKNLQQLYFPDCELTNATIKMKINSGCGDLPGKVGGVPCLERRTVYEGRVTDMPVKFEELLKEAGANQGEDIVVDRNNSSSFSELHSQQQHQQISLHLNNNQQHHSQQQQQQQQLGKESTLRLTFHHQQQQQQQQQQQVAYARAVAAAAAVNSYGSVKDVRLSGRQGHNNNANGDQYHYMWDSSKSGWTWTKSSGGGIQGAAAGSGDRYSSLVPYGSLSQQQQQQLQNSGSQFEGGWQSQQQQQQQFGDESSGGGGGGGVTEFWEKRDVEHMHSLWLKQQQLHSQPQQRFGRKGSVICGDGRESLEYFDQGGSPSSSAAPTNSNIINNKGRVGGVEGGFTMPHGATSSLSSESQLLNVNSNMETSVDQQLSSYLKSYKYMKPNVQQGYAGMHIGGSITRGSPIASAAAAGKALSQSGSGNKSGQVGGRARGGGNQQQQQQQLSVQGDSTLNLKRPISPRTALEQFERLKKYWDYQHQLLEADDFSSSGDRQLSQHSSSSYGGHTPAKMLRTGAQAQAAYLHQQEAELRGGGFSGPVSAVVSQSAPPSLSQSQAHAYQGLLQGPSSSWGGPVGTLYGGRGIGTHGMNHPWGISQPGGVPASSAAGSGNPQCNWAVSVTEISPQTLSHHKQTIAGAGRSLQESLSTTNIVSKERLVNLSRSSAAAAAGSSSSVPPGMSKRAEVCKALATSEVSNLYCTTINRVPVIRDQRKPPEKPQTPLRTVDSFEYDKAVLIGPISNNESGGDLLEMCGSKSALELSKLAKKHERQASGGGEQQQQVVVAAETSKKTSASSTCEDNDVPRDMTVPRRSRSDDGIIFRKESPSGASTVSAVVVPEVKEPQRKESDAEGVARRNSDDPVSMSKKIGEAEELVAELPERSKSTPGSNHDTVYDHIVLLDKRVKTYMCKRCLETLKSEQEIRNHLFCKMLSNTVQCHVCRHLFTSEEYPEHLQNHAVNAKQ